MWKQQAMSQSLIEITSRASTPHGLCKGFSSQITKILMSNSATNSDLIAQPAFFRICNDVFTAHEPIGTFSRPENRPANTTPPAKQSLSNSSSDVFAPLLSRDQDFPVFSFSLRLSAQFFFASGNCLLDPSSIS
ncbi:hypothetical protein V6N11_081216 [Hibiscus sabdariffa]|uniref:Uncharacterized protein n=1 Tax=Hibiscus sabdariffa TaxID=183260 RepID=A0ABR2QJ83_9ROSI